MIIQTETFSLAHNSQSYACAITLVQESQKTILRHPFPSFLTDQDRRYLENCHPRRQHSFLLGRHAFDQGCLAYGIKPTPTLSYGCFGQPSINNTSIQVSIAHAENTGIALLFPPNLTLGIDIEFCNAFHKKDVGEAFMTKHEYSLPILTKNTPLEPILWTAKEALLKALKIGFSTSLGILEIASIEKKSEQALHVCFRHFHAFHVCAFIYENAVISVAYPANYNLFSLDFFGKWADVFETSN